MIDAIVFTHGYELEVIGSVSKVFDLERVEIEGLPVNVKIPEPKKAANLETVNRACPTAQTRT